MATVSLLRAAPSAGFEQPFEMLAACHERVERLLRLLLRLADHLPQQGADGQARDAARDVMRYFDIAAPAHHEDEERHLLPALRAAGQPQLAQRIETDHQALQQLWQQVRADLQAVTEGVNPEAAQFATWRRFAATYRQHIMLEDENAFGRARAVLDAAAQQAMGAEMAARRGLR